jgi:hypothetical protein
MSFLKGPMTRVELQRAMAGWKEASGGRRGMGLVA